MATPGLLQNDGILKWRLWRHNSCRWRHQKFYHVIQIILQMCLCDQSLVNLGFLWEKLSQPQFCKDLTKKQTIFFERWPWFKFNNLGLALSSNLKFYTSVAKGSKLKIIKFLGIIPTFVEVKGEKLVVGGEGGCWVSFLPHPLPHPE